MLLHRSGVVDQEVVLRLGSSLAACLGSSLADHREGEALAAVLLALAGAGVEVASLIASGDLASEAEVVGGNAAGDPQLALDRRAHALFRAALRRAPVAAFASEEAAEVEILDRAAPLAVAIDPLDGSSNIETNLSLGSIFSVLPVARADHASTLLGAGNRQLAAGFFVYGPRTALVLTTGDGTDLYLLDRAAGELRCARRRLRIAPEAREYAINASNSRFWAPAVRGYVEDCMAGAEGPRGVDFNTRWLASLVAEALRILVRGGVFLYPADSRPGYGSGRLRLLYEAAPIAMIVEQAGGAATDGMERILDLAPSGLHQRVPLVFGSAGEVERIRRRHQEPPAFAAAAPLFGRRGLFRA